MEAVEINNMTYGTKKIRKFIKERNAFSSLAFGSPKVRNCLGPLHHLQEEVKELIDNPGDDMEWADCFLLLLDAAWRQGHSVEDLFDFAIKKLAINKKRKWKLNENGVYNHIEEDSLGNGQEHEEIMREIMGLTEDE